MESLIEGNSGFVPFPKITRLSRDIVITEKLDGTSAQIEIDEITGEMRFGSRNRYITPEDDNYGFAKWATANADELTKLGPGRHYGEYWGQGIQRKYGLLEKRFSLFNVGRWTDENKPTCCHVVPVLYKGPFETYAVDRVLGALELGGSIAAPGFMNPEGIIIFHTASGHLYKKTIKDDESPKSRVKI